LSDDERAAVDAEALRILSEVGVRFPSEMALDTLESGGAAVDRDAQTALIPPELVRRALASSPKEVFFGARDRSRDFTLSGAPEENRTTLYNLDGCGIFTLDHGARERRPSVLADVAAAARVFDELEAGMLAWPPISPEDVAIAPRSIISAATVMMNTSKHVMDEVKTREEVPYMAEISSLLAGGRENLAKRCMYSVTYCTVSPLTHDCDMMEATMDISRIGAPILVYPTPATGTTGPASLFGNVALAVAEALSGIVLFQLHSPACPLVMGAAMGAVNGRTGAFSYGMPETALQLMAVGEMCSYYGMPSFIAGMTADAKLSGIQASLEKMMTAMPLVLSGAGMVNGMGLLECGMTLSLEQMVIDGEMAALMGRLREGIDFREGGRRGDDSEQRVGGIPAQRGDGPGFRENGRCGGGSEQLRGDGGNLARRVGSSALAYDLVGEAHKRVEAILSAEQRLPMDEALERQIKEVLNEASAKLGDGSSNNN
jgi:trimethylamine--corrinoid protein Co-methyltransferase